jgi:hypothetical protein
VPISQDASGDEMVEPATGHKSWWHIRNDGLSREGDAPRQRHRQPHTVHPYCLCRPQPQPRWMDQPDTHRLHHMGEAVYILDRECMKGGMERWKHTQFGHGRAPSGDRPKTVVPLTQ